MSRKPITLAPGEEITIKCAATFGEMEGVLNHLKTTNKSDPMAMNVVENNNLGGGKRSHHSTKTRKSKKGGPKRSNPFMNFAKGERKVIISESPNLAITEIGKELGKRWRALYVEENLTYK